MTQDPLKQWVESLLASDPNSLLLPVFNGEDAATSPPERGLKYAPVEYETPIASSIEEAREIIASAIKEYGDLPNPAHMLVLAPKPGVGKTYVGVKEAERQVEEHGRPVLYAGPRHDLFDSILKMADHKEWWYEWQPRRLGDPKTLLGQTCRHEPNMNKWTARGYRGVDFCAQMCGWDYIQEECPYYEQIRTPSPIIYGMHQHVFLGHPRPFGFLIGDEYPIAAALRQWIIPQQFIVPSRLDPLDNSPALPLMRRLAALADSGENVQGRRLMEALGGAEEVYDICRRVILHAEDVAPPNLKHPSDAGRVGYKHIIDLLTLLQRESMAYMDSEEEYISRVVIAKGRLMLLLRRKVNKEMPRHVVWLDGTANERLYEVAFNRPVKVVRPEVRNKGTVFQLWDRANGKKSLINKDEEGQDVDVTHRVEQTKRLIDTIVQEKGYQNPSVFTFMAIEPYFEGYVTGHFGAATGSNDFINTDAIFVVGAPLPNHEAMKTDAAMLYQERMQPFQSTWSRRTIQYPGQNFAYDVGGFWADPDLQAIVEQIRDASIVQAAHRSRASIREVDVYLLTNIPLRDFPPDHLLSARDILNAPVGINPYQWLRIVEVAETKNEEQGFCSADDLMESFHISKKTAYKYLNALLESSDEWQEFRAVTKGKGRPPRMINHK